MVPERYELIFQHLVSSAGTVEEDVVVVHRTHHTGPGGHPIYCDDTGIVRAEISDRGEVRMLATGSHQALLRPKASRVLS